MPHLTFPLVPAGCEFPLWIGVSRQRGDALRAANLQIPDPIKIRAVVDTGASATAIDDAVIVPLGLSPTGTTQIHTPSTQGTTATCITYDVSLGVYHQSHSLFLANMQIVATHLASTGTDALIGRDFLAQCLFIYDGASNSFTLAF